MSTAHVTFDDYAIPSPGSPQTYELNLGSGISRPSSLYPHGHLEASLPGSGLNGQVSHIPARPAHTYLAPHPDLLLHYQFSGGPGTLVDLNAPYASIDHPPSPQGLYTATSGWTVPGGYRGYYNPDPSVAFLQNLSSVIESSHTAQTQQQNAANIASSAQPSGAAQSSWTGSIDLATGVFQRSVEHPRLRTAQACEKCRVRKAKCTGEQPCKRCAERTLKCEYAPERKMRGPNKNKRKACVPRKRSTASPASDRTLPDSVSTPTSSSSDSAASGRQRSESSPSAVSSYVVDISSNHSSPVPAYRASPKGYAAFRPRSATVGQDPSGAFYHTMAGASTKPRPPRLDLTAARETYPRLMAEYARATEQASYPVPVETGRHTHTALPTYLTQAYSRIALSNANAATAMPPPPPLGSRPVPQDASRFVHPSPVIAMPSSFPSADGHAAPSNSPDMSTPATPLSLSLAYDATGRLMYPDGMSAFDGAFDTFEASPMPSDDGHLCAFDQDGWQAAAAAAAVQAQLADDETPRAAPSSLMAELMGPVDAMTQ